MAQRRRTNTGTFSHYPASVTIMCAIGGLVLAIINRGPI